MLVQPELESICAAADPRADAFKCRGEGRRASMFCKHLEDVFQNKLQILSRGYKWAAVFVLVTEQTES